MLPKSCRFLGVLLSLTIFIVSWFVARYCHSRLPPPVKNHSITKFVARYAKRHLERLSNYGPRPVGSYENDIQTVAYLESIVTRISSSIPPDSKVNLEMDTQNVSGTFFLKGYNIFQKYENIKNFVVRLSNTSYTDNHRPSILVNCHFDSVPQGPGASDDGVSCGIMLEIMRLMVTSPRVHLHNDIIFLFNGAEESILVASHGFITQHKWASDVKAFINLEAAGSGGRELLFQSGPGHPWLVQSYIKSAPHPFGSIIGEEIFQSGVIPSDTDFRIFRDFGRVPGLDIAYVSHGHVYHTEYDTSQRIPDGSIQRAGDNILSVLNRLSRLKNLEEVSLDNTSMDDGSTTAIYFDFLGLVMVSYASWIGVIVSTITVTMVIAALYHDLATITKKEDIKLADCRTAILKILMSFTGILIISILINSLTGIILDLVGATMSWYYRPYLLFLLYSLPTIYTSLAVFDLFKNYLNQFSENTVAVFSFHSSNLTHALLASVLTFLGLNSAFVFSNTLLFPLLWWLCIKYFKSEYSNWKAFLFYHTVIFVPWCQWSYLTQLVFTIFVPIMGRKGMTSNPDIFLGVATAVFTFLLLLNIFPILVSVRRKKFMKYTTFLVFISTLCLVSLTNFGFPYSSDMSYPAPKRLSVFHVSRHLESLDDCGLMICRQDHHSLSGVGQIQEYSQAQIVTKEMCDKMLGCGLPSHSIRNHNSPDCLWIPTDPPLLNQQTNLVISSIKKIGSDLTNITMSLSGPSKIMMLISTSNEARLEQWSIGELDSSLGVLSTQLLRGFGSNDPHIIWIVVKGWREGDVTLTVAGHHTSGVSMRSGKLNEFIKKHPSWISVAGWNVEYKYYKI